MLSSELKMMLILLFQKSIQAWLLVEDLLTAAKGYLRFQNLQELLLVTCPYIILKLVKSSEKSRRRLYRPHIVLNRTQSSMTWPWTGCFFEQSKRKNSKYFTSIIKMPGKGLLVLAARPQRQETSWLVLVLYEMDFSIITFQSLVATPRTTL